jgi:pyrimidine operon attenuation protein / uracil phosphoribosyltransferase
MIQKRLILNSPLLEITISRLCHEIIENHGDFSESLVVGLQPRGVYFAERITAELNKILGKNISMGYLDATFYRDDFRRRDSPLKPNATNMPFLIEGKRVILIDDVMQTGRMVRAALDAMTAFGRPKQVELCVLITRRYENELPIQPDYIGMKVNTTLSQRVQVNWTEQGNATDEIFLMDV